MSLMKFAPETVRLRRAARAHAVGEFSLSEYVDKCQTGRITAFTDTLKQPGSEMDVSGLTVPGIPVEAIF